MNSKIRIKICALLIIVVVTLGAVGLLSSNKDILSNEASPLEIAVTRAENTMNSKGFSLGKHKDKITFEQANIGEDVYMAPIYNENTEQYTAYEYLLKNLEFEDKSLWQYNYDHTPNAGGEGELAYLKTDINNSNLHIGFSQKEVNTLFELYYYGNHADDFISTNYINTESLVLLGQLYEEGTAEFDFVKEYKDTEEGLLFEFFYNDYLLWCSQNVEGFTFKELEEDDIRIRYEIKYQDEYVSEFSKLFIYEKTKKRYEVNYYFTNINEVSENLDSYINDREDYTKKLITEVKELLAEDIKEMTENHPEYYYGIDGSVVNKTGKIDSISQFKQCYTSTEMITYLLEGTPLPDKNNDWRIIYAEAYGTEFYITGSFDLVDVDGDGIPEISYDNEAGYSYNFVYIDDNGKVKSINHGDDFIFYNNAIVSYQRGRENYLEGSGEVFWPIDIRVYSFKEGVCKEVLTGYYEQYYRESGNYNKNFIISGSSVSESTYNSKLGDYVDETTKKSTSNNQYKSTDFINIILNSADGFNESQVNTDNSSSGAESNQPTPTVKMLSEPDIEDEVLRIREVYNDIVSNVNGKKYASKTIENKVVAYYDSNGEVKHIQVSKGYESYNYSRFYYFENNKLMFAYVESSDSHRLYFKDQNLFRWRYTDTSNNATNYHYEASGEYKELEQFAITESALLITEALK